MKCCLLLLFLAVFAYPLTLHYETNDYNSVASGIKKVALNLCMKYETRSDSFFIIYETQECFVTVVVSINDSETILDINGIAIVYDFITKKEKKRIENSGLTSILAQALDQEYKGKKSRYSNYINNYGNKGFAYGLTFFEPGIGSFYTLNQGILHKSPQLKWWISIGTFLFDINSISLMTNKDDKLRNLGAVSFLANRFFFGTIIVHFSFAGNDKFKRSGYKFDFGAN